MQSVGFNFGWFDVVVSRQTGEIVQVPSSKFQVNQVIVGSCRLIACVGRGGDRTGTGRVFVVVQCSAVQRRGGENVAPRERETSRNTEGKEKKEERREERSSVKPSESESESESE